MERCQGVPISVDVEAAAVPPLPFLLTTGRGEVARALLSYVAALPLSSPDAQLLAVVVAIRAANTGSGNVTGTDLRSMRLNDPPGVVEALRGLGWDVPGALLGDDLKVPVPVTVPELAGAIGRPFGCGKYVRSRVSGWTARVLSAKPVKKSPPAVRLAALFVAAHGSARQRCRLPDLLPEACRAVVPELVRTGFLEDVADGGYLLAPAVRHLAGVLTPEDVPVIPRPAPPVEPVDPASWAGWKDRASPALRRHVDAVEQCTVCALPWEDVASAFMSVALPRRPTDQVRDAYKAWKTTHPERGPQAAAFTVEFRTEHGHGPSVRQLFHGLGWKMPRPLRLFAASRLISNEWLTDTAPVPWTLRPGNRAHEHGIVLAGTR